MSRYTEEDWIKKGIFIGAKFNYLTITAKTTRYRNATYWECVCDCSNTKIVSATHLKNGTIKSCGCKKFLCFSTNQKYEHKESSYRAKASNYKSQAKRRKIVWNLTLEQATYLLKQNCSYCGLEPSNIYNTRKNTPRKFKHLNVEDFTIYYSGIDRVDNTRGYLIDNVVSCCTICNQAKRVLPVEKFLAWIERLTNFKIDKSVLIKKPVSVNE